MQNRYAPRPPRQTPPLLLAFIDIVLIGVALLVFAYFDHVMPRKGQSVPVFLPSSAQVNPIEEQTAVETASEPAAPVGDFSAKFADKFTDGEVIRTPSSYQSKNLYVTLTKYTTKIGDYDEVYFIEDIYIRNIESLRTVFARDTFGKSISEDVISMSTRTNSVAAINSDYYGAGNAGIVIRNGVLYRSDFEVDEEVLILYRDGTMRVYYSEAELDIDKAMADGAWQSFSFGPAFVDGGQVRPEGFDKAHHDPRTIIAMMEPGHYLFILVDGRQPGYSHGMTYSGCASLCRELGCKVAYNLDGGRTSQMTFLGALVNQPYNNGRDTSDMIYIVDMDS